VTQLLTHPEKADMPVALSPLKLAEPTGFEPATSDVTGRRSNQLNYDSAFKPELSKQDTLV
jgi:hypothetical protein